MKWLKALVSRLTMAPELPVTVRRLELREGDMVVITCERRLSPEEMMRLRDVWDAAFPRVKGIVLDNGMDVATIRDATRESALH